MNANKIQLLRNFCLNIPKPYQLAYIDAEVPVINGGI